MAFLKRNKVAVAEPNWESMNETQRTGALARFKSSVNNVLDTAQDQVTMRAQAKYHDHWREICGGEIDWSNPIVQCESTLCNIAVLRILTDQKQSVEDRRTVAQAYFSTAGWDCYLTGLDESGTPYTDLEKHSMKWWATHKSKKS